MRVRGQQKLHQVVKIYRQTPLPCHPRCLIHRILIIHKKNPVQSKDCSPSEHLITCCLSRSKSLRRKSKNPHTTFSVILLMNGKKPNNRRKPYKNKIFCSMQCKRSIAAVDFRVLSFLLLWNYE